MNRDQKEQFKKAINNLVDKRTKEIDDKIEKLFYAITRFKKGSGEVIGVVDRVDVKNFPKQIEVSNQPKEIKINNFDELDFPQKEDIKVNNFDELVEKMPKIKEVGIKEPKWYKGFTLGELTDKLNKLLTQAIEKISNIIFRVDLSKHKEPDRAIAVTLVDKKGRYVNTGGGSNIAVMPGGGSGGGEASEFDVVNINMLTSDSDVTYQLPKKTRQFFIKLRTQNIKLRIYKQSGGDYFTVPQNGWMSPKNLRLINQTLIMQATFSSPQTIEIIIFK